MIFLLICGFAYAVGAIPFGLLLTRAVGVDLRAVGSGNIGATNVLRTGRRGLALATLALDAAKGALVVLWIQAYGHGGIFAAALCVFLGHLYPFWLGFKGGKGVATGLGVLLAVGWQIGACACAAWLLVAVLLRRSSAAALAAFTVAPFAAVYFSARITVALTVIFAALVFWKHRGNILRLLAGTEPKIGQA